MEENKKSKKELIINIVFIIALITLVIGITYAIIIYTGNSSDNSISTGRISMSYTEPTNAMVIDDALPMSDEEGKAQNNYFEFTITSNASTNANDNIGVEIPYEINLSDITIDEGMSALPKNAIKINLVKVNNNVEENIIDPILISDLSTSNLRNGATKVYDKIDIHKNNSAAQTTTYRLRAWIDEQFLIDGNNTYQYKFTVNVNSQVNVLTYSISNININQTTGGTINSVSNAQIGTTVNLEIKTDEGYVYNGSTITNTETGDIYQTLSADETTFILPAYNVTITPSFTASYVIINNTTLSKNACGGSGSGNGTIAAVAVDLTPYKTITIEGKTWYNSYIQNEGYTSIGVYRNNVSTSYPAIANNLVAGVGGVYATYNGTYTVDVASLSGTYYVGGAAYGISGSHCGYVEIYKIIGYY